LRASDPERAARGRRQAALSGSAHAGVMTRTDLADPAMFEDPFPLQYKPVQALRGFRSLPVRLG
jgi:hypothetical protein